MSGAVFGIGVGPGDPRLLTLRAAEVLRSAALVVAPIARADARSAALAIAREFVPASCEVAEMLFPMSEDPADRAAAANTAADRLAATAGEGGDAAFVTLGDAMLYSTWGYVLRALKARHSDTTVDTVPGITAMSACASRLGEPLAEGRDPLLVWPAAPPSDLSPLLDLAPNVVALKAGRHLGDLVASAVDAGATVSAARRCGMDGERLVPDAAVLAEEPVEYFTTAFVRRKR